MSVWSALVHQVWLKHQARIKHLVRWVSTCMCTDCTVRAHGSKHQSSSVALRVVRAWIKYLVPNASIKSRRDLGFAFARSGQLSGTVDPANRSNKANSRISGTTASYTLSLLVTRGQPMSLLQAEELLALQLHPSTPAVSQVRAVWYFFKVPNCCIQDHILATWPCKRCSCHPLDFVTGLCCRIVSISNSSSPSTNIGGGWGVPAWLS